MAVLLIENIAAPPNVSENTHSGYEVDVRVHLIPGIGAHWLDKLEAEHLEKLYTKMLGAGRKAGHGTSRSPHYPERAQRGQVPRAYPAEHGATREGAQTGRRRN
jgi:integrase